MNMIPLRAFDCFKLYTALKLHFTSEAYDFFKHEGRIRATEKGFSHRNDRFFFVKLSKHPDPKGLILSNLVYGDMAKWIGDLIKDEEAEKIYKVWKRRIESLSYSFEQDLLNINTVFNSNFKVEHGRHPDLLKYFLQGLVSYETLIILDSLINFSRLWTRDLKDDIVWNKLDLKLRKYKPFLNFDHQKFKKIILSDRRFS